MPLFMQNSNYTNPITDVCLNKNLENYDNETSLHFVCINFISIKC